MAFASSTEGPNKPIEVLTYGGGAMGALYSFVLSRNTIRPVRITIVCRSNYPQVLSSGYSITSELLGNHTYTPHRVVRDISELLRAGEPPAEFDYIFVATKATAPGGKVDIDPQLVTPGKTAIVLLQNGVGIEEPYRAAFPNTPVISAVCYVSVLQPEHGKILHVARVDMVYVGLYPPPTTTSTPAPEDHVRKTELLADMWRDGGCNPAVVQNIVSERWRKTVWNGCWNVICCLTGLDTHSVLESSPGSRALVRNVSKEIVHTARRVLGIEDKDGKEVEGVDEEMKSLWDVGERVEMNIILAESTVPITPSMLQDARKGAEMEVEVLCGNIVREAERLGVDVPILSSLYPILLAMNHRFQKSKL